MKTLLISFSGGRTSAYMAYQILSGSLKEQYAQKYNKIIPVFLNTSAEHADTYRFVDDCVRFWGWENFICLQVKTNIDRKANTYEITTIQDCAKNGELFLQVGEQYRDFSFLRSCTRELKQRVFNKFVADNFKNETVDRAIGIRADEPKRYREKQGFIYPLVTDMPTEKEEVIAFFKGFDFDLKIPEYLGNCVYCFCKSDNKLYKAVQDTEHSPLFKQWAKMDAINPLPSYRKYRKFKDLVSIAQSLPRIDDLFAEKRLTGGCSESCEPI